MPAGWTTRTPELADLPRLLELRGADKRPWTGSGGVDEEAVTAELVGQKSWTRRQLVAVAPDGEVRAWATVHDRAAGRTMVHLYVDRSVGERGDVAAGLYAWLEEQGREIAVLRGLEGTQLDASPFADDTE